MFGPLEEVKERVGKLEDDNLFSPKCTLVYGWADEEKGLIDFLNEVTGKKYKITGGVR